jgi:drug/metabolite transporter (DMT)-like permease
MTGMALYAGVALVTFGDARQSDSGKTNSIGGDLLVLLSGLCYAAYTVRVSVLPCLANLCSLEQ